jgi:hypothetical protein
MADRNLNDGHQFPVPQKQIKKREKNKKKCTTTKESKSMELSLIGRQHHALQPN